MMKYTFILSILLLFSCSDASNANKKIAVVYPFVVSEMTDAQYPDNPDIGYRASNYGVGFFQSGELIQVTDNQFDLLFYTTKKHQDTILFNDFKLLEYIPTIPQNLKEDNYMAYLSIINQEWNRNQVKFNTNEFKSTNDKIIRVDVARNCLNAYLWEVIAYTTENGKTLPLYHGWFNFPKKLYANLFKEKNNTSINPFLKGLEEWIDPKHFKVKRKMLSQNNKTESIAFSDRSDSMYPLEGAREKKYREIIYPTTFKTMRELQTDSTTFATFSKPGFYNRADPRKTELGRLYQLLHIKASKMISTLDQKEYLELELQFSDKKGERRTQLILGGLKTKDFPALSINQANDGWKTSMGFSNHSFYEEHKEHEKCTTKSNPYYGFLADDNGAWMDSHKVGIDGPLIHWDNQNPKLLHLWLLSFERHALVGHYTILFKN